MVRTELSHLVKQPSEIAWQLGFPIVPVLPFVYVFGSAMEVGGGVDYKTFAMPGMLAMTMTMAFGFMTTAYIVAIQKERGRHGPLPLDAHVSICGRHGSWTLRCPACRPRPSGPGDHRALVIGWRSAGILLETLAAFALLLLPRFCLIWVGSHTVVGDTWIETHSLLMAVVWPLLITAVFLPLAIRRYRGLDR